MDARYLALLAKACEIPGQIEEGLTLLDDALAVVEQTGNALVTAEPTCSRRSTVGSPKASTRQTLERSRRFSTKSRRAGRW